ncbi:SIMPL domain-containing protein [Candidatus Woesearchaeota archaeon]|nr:SIMPL domain-containing protein [Candidatus Woesearchaeota archaeon]
MELTKSITSAIMQKGLKKDEVKTVSYYSYYSNELDQKTSKMKKYFLTLHCMSVNLSNFDKIGEITEASVSGGASVNHIHFYLSLQKQRELKNKLFEAATKDAREKANAIAAGLNLKVKKVINASEDFSQEQCYPTNPIGAMQNMASSVSKQEGSVNYMPQNTSMSVHVKVVFGVK